LPHGKPAQDAKQYLEKLANHSVGSKWVESPEPTATIKKDLRLLAKVLLARFYCVPAMPEL